MKIQHTPALYRTIVVFPVGASKYVSLLQNQLLSKLYTICPFKISSRLKWMPTSFRNRQRAFFVVPKYNSAKAPPTTRHVGAWGERRYTSYTFSTSALDGGEWSASRPGRALAPVKGPPVPIVQEAVWAPEPVWTQRLEEKSFASTMDRTPISRSSSL
jgi:hypothetical protein